MRVINKSKAIIPLQGSYDEEPIYNSFKFTHITQVKLNDQ